MRSRQQKDTSPSSRFRFVTEATIKKNHLELTRWQSAALRRKLPKGIYWLQLASGGLIQWNWTLLQDYISNGDCLSHQALVEEYIATLPKAA